MRRQCIRPFSRGPLVPACEGDSGVLIPGEEGVFGGVSTVLWDWVQLWRRRCAGEKGNPHDAVLFSSAENGCGPGCAYLLSRWWEQTWPPNVTPEPAGKGKFKSAITPVKSSHQNIKILLLISWWWINDPVTNHVYQLCLLSSTYACYLCINTESCTS